MDDQRDREFPAHPGPGPAPRRARRGRAAIGVAAVLAAAALFATCTVSVNAGTAVLITAFGAPNRVLTGPGLAFKLPAPVQTAIPVDLRLRTTLTSVQDVATRDGQRVLIQVFVAWQVSDSAADVTRFVQAAGNDPDGAADQLRGLAEAALPAVAAGFDMTQLVNADPGRIAFGAFEARLAAQLAPVLQQTDGIAVRQVGIARLSLPDAALAASITRRHDERAAEAAARTADGLREAARIRAEAARDSRITLADAQAAAAAIEAASRRQAAEIEARAYVANPQLYTLLRSLDTLSAVIGPNTRLVLRTDAAPFSVLVSGPPLEPPK